MKSLILSMTVMVTALGSAICTADTPIATPLTSFFCSNSGRYCATSKASESITVITDKHDGDGKKVWSVKEFVPDGFISDDGKVVASCYPGKNLVPDTADLKFTVAKLFDVHGRFRAIVLGDLYSSMEQLPETVSHKEWGRCIGFSAGDFEIERADGSIWKIKEAL